MQFGFLEPDNDQHERDPQKRDRIPRRIVGQQSPPGEREEHLQITRMPGVPVGSLGDQPVRVAGRINLRQAELNLPRKEPFDLDADNDGAREEDKTDDGKNRLEAVVSGQEDIAPCRDKDRHGENRCPKQVLRSGNAKPPPNREKSVQQEPVAAKSRDKGDEQQGDDIAECFHDVVMSSPAFLRCAASPAMRSKPRG